MTTLESLWKEITVNLNDKKEGWWCTILNKYSDTNRVYHDFQHIENKYSLFKSIESQVKNKDAVLLAIFFNHLEYDPQSMDNSERNIQHFKDFSAECGIPADSDLFNEVIALLSTAEAQLTDEHKTEGVYGNEDRHFFLDLDMAVLGSEPEAYKEYAEKVKKEYHFLPGDMYNSLRVKVLQNFLQIPNIFATKEFRDKLEQQARTNIQSEISSLQ